MKLFRITNSETKKILTRPSLYIMGIFLAILLVFTAVIYNPTPLENSTKSYQALTLNGVLSPDEVIRNFNTVKNSYTDAKVSDLGAVINFYSNKTLDFSTVYSNKDENSTAMAKLNSAFIAYSAIDSNDKSIYEGAKKNLEEAYTNFKNEYNKFFSTSYPIIRITENDKAEIEKIINLLDNHIYQQILTIPNHNTLINTLTSSKLITDLQKTLSKIENIEIENEVLAELNNINNSIKNKLSELELNINNSETVEEIQLNAARYVSVKTMGERLIGNKLYLELVKNKSDYSVNKLNALNTNPFVNDKQEVFFKNFISENIAIDSYLYENNQYDFEYNRNFSKFSIMGKDAQAFDYAFYSMELIAFFIIMCACITAATSIAGEYTSGTIKMLAVRPYKRSKIISSKFLSTLLLTFLLLLLSAIIVIITGIINYGINFTSILTVFNGGSVFVISPILMFIIYFLTILIKAIVFISIAMMFSVLFKSVTPAIIVSLLTYFVAPIFTSFVPLVPVLTFLPLINIDLFKFFGNQFIASSASQNSFVQIFTSQNFLSSNIFITLSLVIVSIALCLITTFVLFKKRDI